MTITATIVDTEPDTVYQGTVYEQTVEIELENGQILELFDGGNTVSPKMVGEELAFVLSVNPKERGVETLADDVAKIGSARNRSSQWSYDFYGRLEATDVEDIWFSDPYRNLLVLDVGVGTILVTPTTEIRELLDDGTLGVGDCAYIPGARVDIVEVREVDR